jgi:hypothetical protein
MKLKLFQTLEHRDNADEVEKNGPFKCKLNNAWLGHGYYFWDADIDLAHWWGERIYESNGKSYFICEADAILDDTCWDLLGNGFHRMELVKCVKEFEKFKPNEELKLSTIINFLVDKKIINYKAVRIVGYPAKIDSRNNPSLGVRLMYVKNDTSFLPLHPPVQICLYEKNALSLRGYRIIHPPDFSQDYLG